MNMEIKVTHIPNRYIIIQGCRSFTAPLGLPRQVTMDDYMLYNTYRSDGALAHETAHSYYWVTVRRYDRVTGDTIEYQVRRANSVHRRHIGSTVLETGRQPRTYHQWGYIDWQADGTVLYYFFDRDHLGSVRTVRRGDTPSVLQSTSYTASGIPVQGLASVADRHMHTGKPWQNLGGLAWYDNRARWYDPVTMRFTTPDPLAEQYPETSPWAYCANNPINIIDPTGKIIEDPDGYIQSLSLFYANSYRGMKNYIAENPNMDKKNRAILNYCAALYYSKAMELGTLEASDQVYRIEQSNSLEKGTAYTFFDHGSRKIITRINMPINDSKGLVAHENEHWHQFEVGELSYDFFNGDAGFLYNMIDEINSYNIQSVVDNGIFFQTYDLKKNKIPDHSQYLMLTKEASKNTRHNIFRISLTLIPYGKKTTIKADFY